MATASEEATDDQMAEEKPAERLLVRHMTSFRTEIRRLVQDNEVVKFMNQARDLKIILRNDPVDDASGCIEVGIELNKETKAAAQLEPDGWVDDDALVVTSVYFTLDSLEDDVQASAALEELVDTLEEVYLWFICANCKEHFVKPSSPAVTTADDDLCRYCRLFCGPGDLDKAFCAICQQMGSAVLFKTLPCCKNRLHKACATKCTGKCPMCRGNMNAMHVSVSPSSTSSSSLAAPDSPSA